MTRHLAIGDIHGCFDALQTLVWQVDPRKDDVVVTLGDYVDRGPNTREVIEWLIDYHATNTLVALRGNHEIMMMNARVNLSDKRRWGKFGGIETLDSYAANQEHVPDLVDIPESHWNFLSQLQAYHETDDHIFVHAMVDPRLPMKAQPSRALYWDRYSDKFPGHQSKKKVICGHKSQDSGLPTTNGQAICIDTGACKGGWLTCFDVDSGQIWQANQSGETREMHVDDLLSDPSELEGSR